MLELLKFGAYFYLLYTFYYVFCFLIFPLSLFPLDDWGFFNTFYFTPTNVGIVHSLYFLMSLNIFQYMYEFFFWKTQISSVPPCPKQDNLHRLFAFSPKLPIWLLCRLKFSSSLFYTFNFFSRMIIILLLLVNSLYLEVWTFLACSLFELLRCWRFPLLSTCCKGHFIFKNKYFCTWKLALPFLS